MKKIFSSIFGLALCLMLSIPAQAQVTNPLTRTGTWTPVLTFGGASVGITYSIQQGYYTVVGNRVFANMTIALTSKGSSVGTAIITGLPFASSSASNNYSIGSIALNTMATTLTPTTINNPGSSNINMYNFATGTLTGLANTDFNNTSTVQISLEYQK